MMLASSQSAGGSMNIVERVYTTGVCASGGYEARLVDKDGDVWAVKSFYPDDYFVCDIRVRPM